MLVHLLKPPDPWHTKRDKGMAYLDEAGIGHKENCILNRRFIVNMGRISKWVRIFMQMPIASC